MTPRQKELVQSTFLQVAPIAPKAAELFYGRLFELDASLRPLFKGDMAEQGAKLMKTLGYCVNGLDDLGAIVPAVEALGQRHVGYGVKPEHYGTVGAALLWTLAQGLGPAFTDEVKDAWATVFGILASTMQKAAASA